MAEIFPSAQAAFQSLNVNPRVNKRLITKKIKFLAEQFKFDDNFGVTKVTYTRHKITQLREPASFPIAAPVGGSSMSAKAMPCSSISSTAEM